MDSRRHLDPEGYILPEADLSKVPPAYAGLPASAAGLLLRHFGSRLHSGYLYGSIVRGNAVPGRSDADLVAVLWSPSADEDRRRARQVERDLLDRRWAEDALAQIATQVARAGGSESGHG
jgi:uncharacterized protein